MPWQKVTRHISDRRIVVESKSGNTYPADTNYDRLGEIVYSHMMNEKNDWDLWAWVEFPDDSDNPVVEEIRTGDPQGGPPSEPLR